MPAKAGIQKESALVFCSASWIPGLAWLARNDGQAIDLSLLTVAGSYLIQTVLQFPI